MMEGKPRLRLVILSSEGIVLGTLGKPMVRRKDTQVKIDTEVVAEAKMVSASRNITLAEYLSEVLRPIVRRDLEIESKRRLDPSQPRPKKTGGA